MLGRWRRESKLGIVRIVIVVFLLLAFAFIFYFWRLGTLTSGLGPIEVDARASSSTMQFIQADPVYAPHKILSYSVVKIFGDSALLLRSVSAVLAILFLFCFYQLVKGWFGKMISFFGTLFLAATPWFILLARSGGPEILLLAPIVVLASYYWLTRSKSRSAWLALTLSSGVVIYLPGGILLILLGAVFARSNLTQAAKSLDLKEKSLVILTLLIFLAPLVYAGIRTPSAIKSLVLIPTDWPSIAVAVKTVVWDVLALFWRSPLHVDFIIGRLPMFGGAQIALTLFGVFALFKLARSKLYLLLGMVIFGVLAAGINRNLAFLTFVLPVIALMVAAGLRYLYMQWRSVFPTNPLPKYLALSVISALVVMFVLYGLRYSLIAWPNSSATRSAYVLK